MVLNLVTPELAAQLAARLAAAAAGASAPAGRVGRRPRSIRRRRRMPSSRGASFPTWRAEGYGEMFTAAGFGELVEAARGGAHPAQLLEQVPAELAAAVGLVGTRG